MILTALIALSLDASRLPAPKPEPVVRNPDWLEKPNGDDFADAYPEKAQIAGVGGGARVQCAVTVSGLLANCRVVAEDPAGFGFGEAALKISTKFRMTPKTRDGVAVSSGEVVIPIHFQPPQGMVGTLPGDGASFGRPLVWAARPSALDVGDVYPRVALQSGVAGVVGMVCKIQADGTMADCRVMSENPAQIGFGDAALKLAPKFRAVTETDDGDRTAGAVAIIPVAFRPQAQTPVPSAPAKAPPR